MPCRPARIAGAALPALVVLAVALPPASAQPQAAAIGELQLQRPDPDALFEYFSDHFRVP
jgi:hypothetical protein